MRRNDREITNFEDIVDILRRANTIRVGLFGDEYPYIVPLSYGFETVNGSISIYLHGSKEGLKHDLLVKNSHVCVETDIFHRYVKNGNDFTVEYESVIGFGIAEMITGDEAAKGMNLLLDHCGFTGFEYDKSVLERVRMIKITLTEFTGKRRFVYI
jgi:nitroimidazol reductase NimA-like FMN-containing flavoprotein (pyridoxamine 5'-phosphate oxidase superfamily)